MPWYVTLTIMFGMLLVFLFSGLPVALAFITVNFVVILMFMGGPSAFTMVVNSGFQMLNNFLLIPIPLFVMMGSIVFTSGAGWLMIDSLDNFIGRVPARLSVVVVAFGAVFGTVSGVPMGTVAMLGKMFSAEMLKRGYSKMLTLGPICVSGVLTMIIPPSSMAIILGGLAQASIGKILVGLFIPGFMLAALCIIWILFVAIRYPGSAPKYEPKQISFQKRMKSLGYILPLAIVIFAVTVVIYLGIATPTEAAATGTLAMFAVVAGYGKFSWKALKSTIIGTAEVTSMVLFIIWGSITFSQILAFTGSSAALAKAVGGLPLPPVVIVIIMQLIVALLTRFMDLISVTVITTPIFVAVINTFPGIDLIWFCCLTVCNLGASTMIPPFGMELFTMKGVAPPEITMGDIIKGAFPFYLVLVVGIALLIIFPQIIMVLPNAMH
jgi:tripartite ATP-independent transporter DctM subunit